jgi:hypothetical protein
MRPFKNLASRQHICLFISLYILFAFQYMISLETFLPNIPFCFLVDKYVINPPLSGRGFQEPCLKRMQKTDRIDLFIDYRIERSGYLAHNLIFSHPVAVQFHYMEMPPVYVAARIVLGQPSLQIRFTIDTLRCLDKIETPSLRLGGDPVLLEYLLEDDILLSRIFGG